MEKEKRLYISVYNDYYGALLTPHQREMIRLYYDCDISLNEIAEQYGISRQAVRDAIVRGEKLLEEYEDKLGAVGRLDAVTDILRSAAEMCTDERVKIKLNDALRITEGE